MKYGAYGPFSEPKYPQKQILNKRKCSLAQRPPWQRIENYISDPGCFAQVKKTMVVNPEAIGTLDLFVSKLEGRLPSAYLCPPCEWNTQEPEFVIDDRAFSHGNGGRCHNMKTKLRRGNPFQVIRIRKKWEHIIDPRVQYHGLLEHMHPVSPSHAASHHGPLQWDP